MPNDANKHTIAKAVEAQFKLKCKSVRITNVVVKAKRIISLTGKRSENSNGKSSDFKKAYVTLRKEKATIL